MSSLDQAETFHVPAATDLAGCPVLAIFFPRTSLADTALLAGMTRIVRLTLSAAIGPLAAVVAYFVAAGFAGTFPVLVLTAMGPFSFTLRFAL